MPKRSINLSLAGFQPYDLDVFKNIVLQLYDDGHSVDDALTFLKSDKSRLRIHPMARICTKCKKGLQLLGSHEGTNEKAKYHCPMCDHISIVKGSIYETAMENLRSRPFGDKEKLIHRWRIEEALNDGTPLPCPSCKSPKRRLIMITEKEGPKNVHGWNSEIFCDQCENDEFSKEKVSDVLARVWPEEA